MIKSVEKMVRIDDPMIREILDFHQAWLPAFQNDWEKGDARVNRLYDEHWDTDEKAEHKEQKRQALNIPLLFAKVLALLGFEKQNSNIITLEPEGKEDELTAEIGTVQMKRIQKKSYFEFLRSAVFFAGIVPLYGIYKVVEEENDEGDIEARIEEVPYDMILWDKNFTRYDMKDCPRLQEFEWVYPEDLELEDGLSAKDFEGLGDESYDVLSQSNYVPVNWFSQENVTLQDGTVVNRRVIKKIHDYKKVNKKIYEVHRVVDFQKKYPYLSAMPPEEWMSPGIELFETEEEADNYILELFDKARFLSLVEQSKDAFIKKSKIVRRLQYTCLAGHKMIKEPEILSYKDFRHVLYFSIFHKGRSWSVFQISEDLQRYYDRIISQLDYSIATDVKTSFDIISTLVDTSVQSLQEFSDALSEGKNTFSLGHGTVAPNPRAGANPEYFTIIPMLEAIADDTWGGKPLRGIQEYSQQSGKAINSLQQAGALLSLNYLQNLSFSDQILGERLLECIQKNYNRKLTLKVNGSELNERVKQALAQNKMYAESATKEDLAWVLYNPNELPEGVRPLSDASFEVSVSKISRRDDEQEILFTKLLNYAKITGIMPPAEMFADAMGFTATQKAMLVKATQEHEKKLAEQAEFQRKQAEAQASLQAMKESGSIMNIAEQNRINAKIAEEGGTGNE